MSLGVAVRRWSVRSPNECAVFDPRTERTWRELDERTSRLADLLADRYDVGRGDRVALLAENRVAVVEVLVGTHKAAGVYVGLNFRLDAGELDGALENAEPRVLLCSGEFAERATAIAGARGIPVLNLDEPGPDGYEQLVASASSATPPLMHRVSPGDDACIVYTSGTTGRPKGVTFDHAAMLQHATIACLEYEIGSDTRYLIQIPHNSSVNITMAPCLVAGAAIGFADNRSFDPNRFAATVADGRVTHTFLVPTQLMRILDQLPDGDTRLSGLRTLGYGSSPIAPDRLRMLIERYGPIFVQLYGMAEIASIGTLLGKHDHVRALTDAPQLLASCGRPSFGMDVLVVDDKGDEVPMGARGEVVFSGPHVMRGYHRDHERTAEAIFDGRMHSGDIAELDADGYLYIVDRLKNLIIRGGQNIVPTEIENVLYRHPAVLEATVVGAPDPEWGERVVAVVALRRDAVASESDLATVLEKSDLARFKRPEEIRVVDSLPKNAVGKIDKQAVRGWFWTDGRAV
jgi:acyl-CoA synthetase (AMP-forming)/AMP-acid ligase II